MPQDECRDCEGFFPDGKGLTNGLCDKCAGARKEEGLSTEADLPPGEKGGPEPEPEPSPA